MFFAPSLSGIGYYNSQTLYPLWTDYIWTVDGPLDIDNLILYYDRVEEFLAGLSKLHSIANCIPINFGSIKTGLEYSTNLNICGLCYSKVAVHCICRIFGRVGQTEF